MGCCLGTQSDRGSYSNYGNGGGPAPGRPDTEADREARALAAERAAQRQQQFESSAVGRAAVKAVKDAKKPINAGQDNGISARDWQN